MASEGRGFFVFISLMLLIVLWNCGATQATNYVVGGHYHWNPIIDQETWPEGKKFYEGDVLEFIYNDSSYDVVVTDKEGHDNCIVTPNSTKYDSGNESLTLPYGTTYYICSVPDYCQQGMKLAIFADHRPRPPPPASSFRRTDLM